MKLEKEKMEKRNINNVQNTERNSRNKTQIVVPIMLILTLIMSVILINTALINNDKFETSKIFPKTILADTVTTQDIGTNVIANFDSDTGELSISTIDTDISYDINKEAFRSFINTSGIDNIRTITFVNEVNAPEDSSELFKDLNALTTINNLNNLNTNNVINMSSMFENTGLTIIDLRNWNTSNVTNIDNIFTNCLSLTEIYTPALYSTETVNLPTDKWYNASDINDNNIYSNYNNTTFSTGSVHLKKLIDYNISYELGIDLEIENPTSYNALSSFTLNNPTREEYTFIGWTGTGINEATKEVTIERGSTGDREYTANWEATEYTITYNLEEGEETTNPTSYTIETEDIILNEPIKEGYTFIGWTSTDIETPTKEVTIEKGSTGNREYTAHWEITEYTITYHLNGGETTNPTSYTIVTEDIELTAPTREGYTFIGWTGTDIEEGPEESILISEGLTGDREYTAHWEAVEYIITYNLEGGEETTNPTSYTIETEDIILNEPIKEGYTFIGWTTTDIETPTKEITIAKGSIGNREYTANWEVTEYTITYNLDGGIESETANPTNYTIETENIVLSEPSKEGYTFIGWTGTDVNVATKEVTIAQGSTGNREYTANWEVTEYTITYNLDGGIEPELANPTSYTIETEDIKLSLPTKEGYVFIGWTGTNIETETRRITISKGSTGNREYTANWLSEDLVEIYTIEYELDGGDEVEANPISYIEYEEDIILQEPTREGYTFIGWTGTDIEGIEKEVLIKEGSTGNRVYTAHWEVKEYTITYDLDGGMEPEPANPTKYTIETEYIQILAPIKEGCIFLGWTGTDLDDITEDIAIIEGLTGDREYIAHWEAIEYTITYDLDGGMEPEIPNPETYTTETEDIILQEPIRYGHRFLGWTGTGIEDGEPIKEVTINRGSTEDREYRAHWEIIEYTITYNLDGGIEPEPTNPTSYTIETGSIELVAPSKEGYRFIGWTGTDIEGIEKKVSIEEGSTGNREYTANWKSEDSIDIYTIEYDLDGGEEITGNPTSYTEYDEDIILKEPIKEGYDFIGWTGTGIEDGNPIKKLTITSGSTGNRKYIANWQVEDPNQIYTIEYNLNGGDEVDTNPTSYTKQDEDIILQAPTREGYDFIGWTGTDITEATKEVIIPKGSKGDRVYKANWKISRYTITYDLNGGMEPEPANPTNYTIQTEYLEIKAPTKEGCIFLGWTGTDLEDITEDLAIVEGLTGDREYLAHWEAIEYTITYDLDGGMESEILNPEIYTVETEDIILQEPIKEGYTFIGWTGTGIEDGEPIKEVTISKGSTEDREYLAHWEMTQYTITYDLDGGIEPESETANPTSYTIEETHSIINKPIKEGYRFIGWTGTDVEEISEEVLIVEGSTGNREYTAHWEAINYTITYNLDGGMESEPVNPISYTIETEDIILKAPSKEGYRFLGWTGTDLDTTTKKVTIAKGSIGNKEYTAQWISEADIEIYTIEYDLDGGNEVVANPTNYIKEDEDIILQEPSKKGYRFIGWTGTDIAEATKEVTIVSGSTGNRKYIAHWEIIEYTITYNLEGGSESEVANPTSYTIEDQDIVLNAPTKEENTFIGWTGTDITEATKEVTIPQGSTGNREYTANWEEKTYTITYELDGGTEAEIENPTNYTAGTEDIVLNEPTKEGYRFIGWTGTDITEATKEVTIVQGSTGDREYTANWEVIEYTITYHLNGGETTNPTTYTIETEDIELEAPTKEGYRFIGWTGTDIEEGPEESILITEGLTGDREYTANWEAIEYTITYDLDGGEETTNSESYTIETEDILLNEPTKEGYRFIGWTGTEVDVATKEVTIAQGSTGNREYTANWEAIEYTITYNLEGGSESEVANPTTYTIEDEDIILNEPTKEGYIFMGWTGTGIETQTKEVTIAHGSMGNREYTAHWRAGEYTITYNLDGGTETTNPQRYTKEDEDIVLNEPTKAGYTFLGWTGTGIEGEEPRKGVTIAQGSIGDREYTAHWVATDYTITYDLAGGTEATPANPTSYTIEDEAIVLKAPTKEGYIFMGWTGTGIETQTKEVTIAHGSMGNREYTAHWRAGEYTITYNLDGGTETTNPQRYTKEDEDIVLNEPTKAGYTFLGWTGTGIEGEEPRKGVTIAQGSIGDREYTAHWVATDYTITYDLAGGTEATPANPTSYTIEDEAIVLKAPTKEGYIFMGWTGTGIETQTKEVTIAHGSMGNREYTAHWRAGEYTITYNLNGGAETTNPEGYTKEDEDIVLNEPTREGYTFIGWTGTDIEEATKEVTITQGSTGDREYTANWEVIEYTITYNLVGGDVSGNPTKYTIEDEAIILKAPTKEEYTFIGWTGTDIEEATKEVTIAKGSTGDREYTANWKAGEYTITYNLNGGTETTNPEGYTKEDEDIVLNEPTREGYTFIGWTGTDIEEATKEVTIAQGSTGNREYTANWEIVEYTITYNLAGGNVSGNPTKYTVETANIILKEPTKEGYIFRGWTGSNGTVPQKGLVIEKGSTGNKEYTANWTADTNIPYLIKHWTQNLNGNASSKDENNYTLADTELLEGITGDKITPATKTYEGFVSPKTETLTITADGNAVLNYYYTRRTDLKCTINYIDKDTKEIIETKMLENQTFESEIDVNGEIKDIENYNYDSIEAETIKIGAGENIINIYYVKKEGKVIVHHYIYDEKEDKSTTQKLVEDDEITGKIGENYSSKKSDAVPANYICTNEQPEGYTGKIAKDTIEVTYYYKLKTSEIESRIDSKVITEVEKDEEGNFIIKAGEEIKYEITYETTIRDYKGKLKIEIEAELPEGTEIDESKLDLNGGTYNKESNTIKWIIDIENVDTFTHTTEMMNRDGSIGEHTETIKKEITIAYAEDYKLANMNLKAKGETILYYPDDYPLEKDEPFVKDEVDEKEKGKIIIHHYIYDEEKNEYTTQKLVEDEEIEKEIGQEYTTSPSNKIPSNYECINEKPEGYSGEITKETKEISYYYKLIKEQPEEKQGKVIVRYVDVETEDGAYEYEITGKVGEKYETEAKEIKYYVLVRNTENTKGEIKEEPQIVTYYYRKLNFNFSVEKTITGIQIDGESANITNDKLAKVEITTGKIDSTNLIVKYNIKVKNQGELDGTAKVLEKIPEGYEVAHLPAEWKENKDGTAETEVELEAGESKTLSIALKWKNKEENLGSQTNTVKIKETNNAVNFKDTNEQDNKSEATVIVSIKTGETVSIIIVGMIITALAITGYITYIIIRKKQPGINKIKFLK